ncbi:UDP-N-acetylglucosamine 2-epimerase (non-hydrolyzing) [Candidatus Uhrbacteria bacterium]|nr:UDP-N-acetylglucosamine 2-epimerase (non-hydrolyzing) [Candidatus Uhrbacteria bacterium]
MLVVILGTRPEIIKTAPVVLEAQRRGIPVAIIHTGQHYDDALDGIFFRELGLPQPAINLRVGSLPVLKQLGAMIDRLHDAFETFKPKVVMVQGDTNSVLAGALAAHKIGIPVAHLEAGLRSDDWDMPEEANRVLAGFVADLHFCPTEVQRERLRGETITEGVHVVGNTVVDAALHYHEIAKSGDTLSRFGIVSPYALLTMHRPSNVDEPGRLQSMIEMLSRFAEHRGWKIVFPVHPRTKARLVASGLWDDLAVNPNFILSEPIGYLDLLALQSSAQLVLTDSGGLQEEANILRVPCVTLRANTERPETVEAGGNVLYAGIDVHELDTLVDAMLIRPRDWSSPFGDGMTAKRVIDILMQTHLSI